jgi:hypothetical protein
MTYPLLRHIFAEGGHAEPELKGAMEKIGRWALEIVKRSDMAKGFEIIPPKMRRRANLRLAGLLSENVKGLGENHRKCRCLASYLSYQARNPPPCKGMKSFIEFRVGL